MKDGTDSYKKDKKELEFKAIFTILNSENQNTIREDMKDLKKVQIKNK